MESPRSSVVRGWSAGAMVLGKLSVPRRATNLDNTEKGKGLLCGWLFGHFFLSSVFSFPLFDRRPDIDSNTVSKDR